jgi:hypothetical protein
MKRIILLVIFIFAMMIELKAQSNSFLGRVGYSWVSGVIGAEYQFKHLGFGVGWMPNEKPLTGEKVNSICYNLTLYGGEWHESSFYLSLGGASHGFQREIYNYNGYYEYDSSPGFILTGGYKFVWENIDLRVGGGWGWGLEQSVGTLEATLGIRLSRYIDEYNSL